MSSVPLRCWCWLMPAVLGLAGCAMQTATGEPEVPTRVAAMDQPPAAERTVPATAKKNIAAAKKSTTAKVAAPEPAPPAPARGEASCARVEDCASVLRAMVAGPDRSWLQRPAAPAVLSNGIRLFAYRALAPRLDCSELALALTEVERAAQAFAQPVVGLEAEQITRTRSLSLEVGDELRAERSARCAAHAKEAPGAIPWQPQG